MNLDSSALKEIARGALRGHWGKSIITTLLATILGAFCTLEFFMGTFAGMMIMFVNAYDGMRFSSYMSLVAIAIVIALLYFFIGGFIRFGHIEYCLALLDRRKGRTSMLFCKKECYWNGVYMKIMCTAVKFAWGLLLIVPGIVAHYTYAMTPYILAERSDYSVARAMKMSRRIMKGYKWSLFCLHFSFILWKILGVLTLGLATIIYRPYEQTAEAALYNEISGRARVYYRR